MIQKKALKAYKPHGTVMFLTLGPNDGVGLSPMGVMGGKMVSAAKGKTLGVPKYWKMARAGAPPA